MATFHVPPTDNSQLLKRRDYVLGKVEKLLKDEGLSPFSSKMCMAYLQSRLQRDNGEEKFKYFLQYLMSKIPSIKSPISVTPTSHALQQGCPNIIPGLRAQPFWETSSFSWILKLESLYPEIRREFFALKGSNCFQPYRAPSNTYSLPSSDPATTPSSTLLCTTSEHTSPSLSPPPPPPVVDHLGSVATDEGDWNVCYLYLHGLDFTENLERCPVTAAAIKAVPRQYNHSLFSALSPHTHVTSHHGPTNKKLRLHLPLVVPKGEREREKCRLRVGEEWRELEEGRCILFDDSFSHEAENNTNKPRVVLIIDIWHPDLSDEEVKVFEFINKAQILAARRLSKQLEEEREREKDLLDENERGKNEQESLEGVIEETEREDRERERERGNDVNASVTTSFFTVIDNMRKIGNDKVSIEAVWGNDK